MRSLWLEWLPSVHFPYLASEWRLLKSNFPFNFISLAIYFFFCAFSNGIAYKRTSEYIYRILDWSPMSGLDGRHCWQKWASYVMCELQLWNNNYCCCGLLLIFLFVVVFHCIIQRFRLIYIFIKIYLNKKVLLKL